MDITRLEVTKSGKMRWIVKIPESGQFCSSVFSYLHNECRLDLLKDGTHYCLLLIFLEKNRSSKDPKPIPRFNITVELGTFESPLRLGLSERTMVHKASLYCLWRRSIDEITRASTKFHCNGILRFIMTLQTEGTCSKSDTGTQTDFTSSGSTVSVKTPLHMSATPCLENLSEDFAKLLDQEDTDPDVEFLCANQSTKAHRTILSVRSPVIASMLNSDMVEGRTGIIKIPDMDADIFKLFLRYLYTGKLDQLTFDVAMNLYEAGDQYAVQGLAKRCSVFLIEHLTVENACDVLVVADAHSDADFVETVILFMLDKRVPLSGDRWRAFCKSHSFLATEVLNRFFEKFSI